MNTTLESDASVHESLTIAGLAAEHVSPPVRKCRHSIVLIPGMWCTAKTFVPLMLDLSLKGYECFALSLEGHGKSQSWKDLGKLSLDDYVARARQAIAVIRRLSGDKVVIVGHSMGELIAARIADLEAMHVVAHIGITSAPPRRVLMGFRAMLRMPKYIGAMVAGKAFKLSSADARRLLGNSLSEQETRDMVQGLVAESGTAAFDITRGYEVKKIACPALLIGASDDAITPRQRPVAKRIGAEFKEVEGCHMLMVGKSLPALSRTMHEWLRCRLAKAFRTDL
ncbi:MAG: alpha/beta hydrolase [Patescibacteria group bacterium]|nr:alpha/beta hydrolase [Patescibacteria group bacterium]